MLVPSAVLTMQPLHLLHLSLYVARVDSHHSTRYSGESMVFMPTIGVERMAPVRPNQAISLLKAFAAYVYRLALYPTVEPMSSVCASNYHLHTTINMPLSVKDIT